ncbi:hypothetical protein L227DRAFT_604445 [Lentinus tigrinus ALCF2SS1-6]|uniref:Uncharacterized protein n=1 Tax=Lentinus tigrinus ALCF2SS1-6 TaxID=1328759 RepID=A0A5C2RTB1_9APHY|nr:hypothetical protein L227DRAFT_604445 [Lentinus tigrinus ALCF2SS1-6]
MPVLATDQPIMSANASSKTRFRNRQKERLANSAQDRATSQARPDLASSARTSVREPFMERLVNSAQDSRDWGLAGSAETQGGSQARHGPRRPRKLGRAHGSHAAPHGIHIPPSRNAFDGVRRRARGTSSVYSHGLAFMGTVGWVHSDMPTAGANNLEGRVTVDLAATQVVEC